MTVSAGVASFEAEFPETVDRMVQSADQLMYAAKESGKNMVVTELLHPART